MKPQLNIFSLAVAATLFTASQSGAVTFYNFTLTGQDLIAWTSVHSSDPDQAPVDSWMYDGARKYTEQDSGDALRSFWGSEVDDFNDWAQNTDARLAQFNLWGYGGTNAEGYGEQFSVVPGADQNAEWDYDSGSTTNKKWINRNINSDEGTLGNEVLSWETTAYIYGIPISSTPDYTDWTFSFTLGVADDFSNWHMGQEGSLLFWMGGTLIDPPKRPNGKPVNETSLLNGNPHNGVSSVNGKYEGNMILNGTPAPVPEPGTMLLFGAGLAGLAAIGRKRK